MTTIHATKLSLRNYRMQGVVLHENNSCLMFETGTKKEHGRNFSSSWPEGLDKSWPSQKTNVWIKWKIKGLIPSDIKSCTVLDNFSLFLVHETAWLPWRTMEVRSGYTQGTSFFLDVKGGGGLNTISVKPEKRCEEKHPNVCTAYKRSCLHQYGFAKDQSLSCLFILSFLKVF